jgi:hypothetical protein
MIEAIRSSETLVVTRATRRHIPEDDILHSRRREYLKYYIALTGWALQRRRNVSPVRYELGFYIPEDILHTDRCEILKSYIVGIFINSLYGRSESHNGIELNVTNLIVKNYLVSIIGKERQML